MPPSYDTDLTGNELAKYIEAVYRTTAAQASLITGATGFMPISVGLIIGGLYISYCKLKPDCYLRVFAELVSVATIGSGLFLPVNR
ncbi:hypothetical protein TYRP_019707 [Tyrophagus putrescentiae]|nr:hypothetical protein TYRP_019707 [Tyrophagus putrescentiae]